MRKLRAFVLFTAIVGKGREDAGVHPLMESAICGSAATTCSEQFAFHRALRSEWRKNLAVVRWSPESRK